MTTETMFGKAVKRKEDPRLITGHGQYVDDIHLPGVQTVVFLRSPYAHAKIAKIDTSAAEKHPGVMKVYTGKDFPQVPVPCGVTLPNSGQISPFYPMIATDVVRHTGEIVAAVIASDPGTARDAAELRAAWRGGRRREGHRARRSASTRRDRQQYLFYLEVRRRRCRCRVRPI